MKKNSFKYILYGLVTILFCVCFVVKVQAIDVEGTDGAGTSDSGISSADYNAGCTQKNMMICEYNKIYEKMKFGPYTSNDYVGMFFEFYYNYPLKCILSKNSSTGELEVECSARLNDVTRIHDSYGVYKIINGKETKTLNDNEIYKEFATSFTVYPPLESEMSYERKWAISKIGNLPPSTAFISNGNYTCGDLYFNSTPSGTAYLSNTQISKYKIDFLIEEDVNSDQHYFTNSTKVCSTFESGSGNNSENNSEGENKVTACGQYGKEHEQLSITSATKSDGTFDYTYELFKTVWFTYKKREIKSFSSKIMENAKTDSSTGCPTELCYDVKDNGNFTYDIIYDGSKCHHKYKESVTGDAEPTSTAFQRIFKIVGGKISCDSASKTIEILTDIFKYIRIGSILLFLVLTSFDYVQAIFSEEKDGFKKSNKHLVTRVIILIIILILPSIINLLLTIIRLNNGVCTLN